MSTARSVFTEAIEDHLALKKQNVTLEGTMPLARYDVGDPLDRYPGGPGRAEGTVVVAEAALLDQDVDAADAAPELDPQATQLMVGPSPEQAMEAASALEASFGAERPFEPLTGMTPMLSLVEDIDEEDEPEAAEAAAPAAEPTGDLLRFPGGVGPRDEAPEAQPEQQSFTTQSLLVEETIVAREPQPEGAASTMVVEHDAPTGEQPVLVIDTDEPLATTDFSEPPAPARGPRRKPRFFGLGRRKHDDDAAGDGWFTDGPRDFNWD